jgi:hypothetical protein
MALGHRGHARSEVVVYRMRHAFASDGIPVVNGSTRSSAPGDDGKAGAA